MTIIMKRCIVSVWLLGMAAGASAAEWTADTAASRLRFSASYQGQTVPGEFTRYEVGVRFDPARANASSLDVVVDIGSADMGSADINDAIRTPEWFDTAKFPKATFRSIDVRAAGDGQFVAHGALTLKGTTRRIEIPFRFSESSARAGMSGALTLNRVDYGIGTGEWATGEPIGLPIKISFDLVLRPVK